MSDWIPLMDYAIKKGVSLSTLRRHIKANKIKFKVDSGRYLLWAGSFEESFDLEEEPLQTQLRKAQEEIAELKTLIAFYEESFGMDGTATGNG